jgi:hypothetical protein
MHKTRGAEERYKEMRKIEKRIHRKKKKAYFEGQMKRKKTYVDKKKAEECTSW